MFIKNIQMKNYRNYESLDQTFHPGITILTGENAQGKTNLLEAIFLLSLAKSHRTKHDQDLILWSKDQAYIKAEVVTKDYEFPLEIIINSRGKIVKVNYLEQKRLSDFIGKINVVLFAPEDLQMIKGAPNLRRKFLDTELGQSQPIYLQALIEYQNHLKQRNRYLKDFAYTKNFDDLYFDILTQQLITTASKIINYRYQFVKKLNQIAHPIHLNLSNQRDHLSMTYLASHPQLVYEDIDSIEDQLNDLFSNLIIREKERGTTLAGPHRDDVIFYINEKPADLYGSQGQQRTIILSLKLAELDLLHELTGEYPILLLDDVLSELDDQRKHLLMTGIKDKVQTFLTTASLEGIDESLLTNMHILLIDKGRVEDMTEGANRS